MPIATCVTTAKRPSARWSSGGTHVALVLWLATVPASCNRDDAANPADDNRTADLAAIDAAVPLDAAEVGEEDLDQRCGPGRFLFRILAGAAPSDFGEGPDGGTLMPREGCNAVPKTCLPTPTCECVLNQLSQELGCGLSCDTRDGEIVVDCNEP